MLTEAQADLLFQSWDERLRRVDESLLALEGESTWQLIAPGGRLLGTLEGETRARVAPAIEAMTRLFEDRERLVAVVERARTIRGTLSSLAFWQNEAKLGEIEALLSGPSIALGAEITPISRRSLLDPGPRELAISPEELLARMIEAYETARDLTARLSRAWAKLEPAVEEIAGELRELGRERPLIEADAEARAAYDRLTGEIATLHQRIARDPLGVDGSLRAIVSPQLEQIRARVSAHRALFDRVDVALASAEGLRRALREADDHAREVFARVRRELAEPPTRARPKAPEELAGLEEWLAKLRSTVAAGRLAAAEIGLARLREAGEAALAELREAARVGEKSLSIRDELRGRVSARAAQLAALRARGADQGAGAEVQATLMEAARLVDATPTDVTAARAAVEALDLAFEQARRRRC